MTAVVPSSDPSTTRITCEHADRCAGCPLIDLTYGEQLRAKGERVAAAFASYGRPMRIEPVLAADSLVGYRGRAKLIVEDGKIGLFAKGGGHQVVDIPHCRVMAPAIAAVTATLRDLVLEPAAASIRALDMREVQNPSPKVLVTLVVDRDTAPPIADLKSLAEDLRSRQPLVAGVAVNYRHADAPQVLGDVTTHLTGVIQAPDAHGRSTHLATFGSFVQAHRDQAGRVHDLVLTFLQTNEKKSPTVLDLYGGSGAIGLALAKAGADVELVESFPPAVDRAREAARTQKLYLHGTTLDVGRALRDFAGKNKHFDAAVANPPRRGMNADARERLAALAPESIIYVSCDPDTLARDLEHLSLRSYAVEQLQPVDMMPLTEEVETVALIRRAEAPPPRVTHEDEEIVAVSKEGHETMHALTDRVRKIAGAEATPLTSLDASTSGVVLFVREPARIDAWREALRSSESRISFLAACRGISREKGVISRGKAAHVGGVRYRRLLVAGGHSVLRVVVDGRLISDGADGSSRKRLAELGHPVLGDARTCDARTNRFFEERNALDRPFLHAVRLELGRPGSEERLVLSAPLAGDLRTTLLRLGGASAIARLEEKNALGTTSEASTS